MSHIILSDSYTEATKKFIKTGRRFDSNLSMEDIFQACRNVWIVNGIQSMMGLPVELTPSGLFCFIEFYPISIIIWVLMFNCTTVCRKGRIIEL